jgi:hypothetical protein
VTRAEYIRWTIDQLKRQIDTEIRAKRIRQAARRCGAADRSVNAEFAAIERDDVEDLGARSGSPTPLWR